MTGTRSPLSIGRASLSRVLDFACDAGAFTATDAMSATTLTRSTTIEAIDTLLHVGLLRELPNARDAGQYRAGRPARRFELPADLGAVVGLDAGDTHLSVTVADLAGRTILRRRADLDPAHSIPQRQAAILAELDAVLSRGVVPGDRVLALCAGVAAPVARDGSSPPHPDGFWQRTNAGLIDLLADRAMVVEVKNDAQLAAAAEGSLGDARGCRDYIALLAGERLGAGVVVDGHLLHGTHGGVGEMFAFDHVRGVGSAFGLGHVIEQRARSLLASGDVAADGRLAALAAGRVDARTVLALAADGDADALRVAELAGESLARVVAVLGSMFDPERIIVCGAIAQGAEPVLAAARARLTGQVHLPAPTLVASRLGADIVTRGAVSRALTSARRRALPRLAEQLLHSSQPRG